MENILNIVYKLDTTREKPIRKMYISYIWQGNDPVIAQIAIRPKQFEKMKTALLNSNANIVFWDEEHAKDESANSQQ